MEEILTAPFYSINDVAKLLGLSIKTVRRYIAAGSLQSITIGGVYRIPKQALEEFINAGQDEKAKTHYNILGEMVEESPKKAKAKRASGERKVKTTARLAKIRTRSIGLTFQANGTIRKNQATHSSICSAVLAV